MAEPTNHSWWRRLPRPARWAISGALILAAVSIILGILLSIVIVYIEASVPADAGLAFWLPTLLRWALIWGLGALPFGAALGAYAALIWQPRV